MSDASELPAVGAAALSSILGAVRGRPSRLLEVLAEIGFDPGQVERCRDEHQAALVALALALVEERLRALRDGELFVEVLRARHGIAGEPRPLPTVARALGLTEERVAQAEERLLHGLRLRVGRFHFESGMRAGAIALLGEPPAHFPPLPVGGDGDATEPAVRADAWIGSARPGPPLPPEDLALVESAVRSFLTAVRDGLGAGLLLQLARGSTAPAVLSLVETYRLGGWGAAGHLAQDDVRRAIAWLADTGVFVRRDDRLRLPPASATR